MGYDKNGIQRSESGFDLIYSQRPSQHYRQRVASVICLNPNISPNLAGIPHCNGWESSDYRLFLFGFFGLLQAGICSRSELVLEFFDPSRRVHKFQLAGIKRMTGAANVHF
jgi:hypothetical protein